VGHATRVKDVRKTYKIEVRKPEEKKFGKK
jgi:hypothetical protein